MKKKGQKKKRYAPKPLISFAQLVAEIDKGRGAKRKKKAGKPTKPIKFADPKAAIARPLQQGK
jgi:hypothetical protein